MSQGRHCWGNVRPKPSAPVPIMLMVCLLLASCQAVHGREETPRAARSIPTVDISIEPDAVEPFSQLRKAMAAERSKARILQAMGCLLLTLLVVGLSGYALTLYRGLPSLRWAKYALISALVVAAAYVFVSIYFDWIIGTTSATSRAGSHVMASRRNNPLLFHVILGAKFLVGALLLLFASASHRGKC